MATGDSSAQSGVTVLEALIATALFMLLMFGAFSMYGANSAVFQRGQGKAVVQQNARVALESAAREIRMAGYDHSGVLAGLASPTAIQAGGSNSISFAADVTGDGVLDRVSYQLSGTQLTRSLASWNGSAFGSASTGVIAESVATLSFSYFDGSDGSIATPVSSGNLGNVRRVTIGLVTGQTTLESQVTFPLIVDVRLRNG